MCGQNGGRPHAAAAGEATLERAGAPGGGRRRRVVLAQLAHALNDRNHWFCNKENFPLAAGYLKAMARARGLEPDFDIAVLEPRLSDHAGDALLARALAEREVDVLGLSLYPWNLTRSLALVEALRAARPGLQVVAGGPEVNESSLEELLGRRGIDWAVPGEGEVTFSEILAALAAGRDPAGVEGVAAWRDGRLHRAPARPTLVDLDQIPSPILDGDLDLAPYRQVHILFERGCVYSCSYCHWWPDKRSHGRFSFERIAAELERLRQSPVQEVILLDAAVNASRWFEPLCDVLEAANHDRRLHLKVHVLFDHFTRGQLERLARCGVRHLEIGLQSADPATLRRANRPTEIERFEEAVAMAHDLPLDLQVDFMLGLPGDTAASVAGTAALIRDVARRQRLRQVSPFVLAVGSASRLRSEAVKLGLRHQPEPPYRVLATDQLGYGELRDLRRRVPEMLGSPPHPCFDFDRPHYALNLFEPELALGSSSHAGAALAPPLDRDPGGAIDGLVLRCQDTAPGHGHPLPFETLAARLNQLVQVRIEAADLAACRTHLEAMLATLSRDNPYTVWDLVVEARGPFDPELLDALAGAIRFRVHNLDWDNYLVNPEEGPGWARLATRLVVVIPLGAASRPWLEQCSRRAAVVHALRLASPAEVGPALDRAAALPGEGVLVEIAPEAAAETVREALNRLLARDWRVRGFRNHALKSLLETETARHRGLPRPRLPYASRLVLDGGPTAPAPAIDPGAPNALRAWPLSARQSMLDATVLAMRLGPRLSPVPA